MPIEAALLSVIEVHLDRLSARFPGAVKRKAGDSDSPLSRWQARSPLFVGRDGERRSRATLPGRDCGGRKTLWHWCCRGQDAVERSGSGVQIRGTVRRAQARLGSLRLPAASITLTRRRSGTTSVASSMPEVGLSMVRSTPAGRCKSEKRCWAPIASRLPRTSPRQPWCRNSGAATRPRSHVVVGRPVGPTGRRSHIPGYQTHFFVPRFSVRDSCRWSRLAV